MTDLVSRLRELAARKWPDAPNQTHSLFGQAADRIEALEADARRYAWLRSRKGLTLRTDGGMWTRQDGSTFINTHYLAEGGTLHGSADSLDAAIDAAIAQQTAQR